MADLRSILMERFAGVVHNQDDGEWAADVVLDVLRSRLTGIDGWGHKSGSPYHGGCGIYFRDTNPPCTCGLDDLRKALDEDRDPLAGWERDDGGEAY